MRLQAEHLVDRPDVEAPRGVEPTGTNSRRQPINNQSSPNMTPTSRKRTGGHSNTHLRLRPPSGPRPATQGTMKGSTPAGYKLRFCGGHGPGETPGPIPNPEAKPWHGDGTMLERAWESSTPPQHNVDEGPRKATAIRGPLLSGTVGYCHLPSQMLRILINWHRSVAISLFYARFNKRAFT